MFLVFPQIWYKSLILCEHHQGDIELVEVVLV